MAYNNILTPKLQYKSRTSKITLNQRELIARLYVSGRSIGSLSREFDIDRHSIRLTLRYYGIPIEFRTNRRHTINEECFSVITPESSYWIGFLMADGCVTKSGYVGIKLSNIDFNHLVKFKNFSSYSGKIAVFNEISFFKDRPEYVSISEMCRIQIKSRIMANNLTKYGVVPNKTLIAKVCDDLAFNRDFWRGVVDGDGSIGETTNCSYYTKRKYPVIKLTGSGYIIQQFIEFVRTISPHINVSPIGDKGKRCFSIRFTHKIASSVIRYLYQDAIVALNRKQSRATEVLSNWDINHSQKALRVKGLKKREKNPNPS